jgi:hypothetical protein
MHVKKKLVKYEQKRLYLRDSKATTEQFFILPRRCDGF